MTTTEDRDRADKITQALAKLDDDLAWRGPGGRTMAYVLLPRALAEAVRDQLRMTLAAADLPSPDRTA